MFGQKSGKLSLATHMDPSDEQASGGGSGAAGGAPDQEGANVQAQLHRSDAASCDISTLWRQVLTRPETPPREGAGGVAGGRAGLASPIEHLILTASDLAIPTRKDQYDLHAEPIVHVHAILGKLWNRVEHMFKERHKPGGVREVAAAFAMTRGGEEFDSSSEEEDHPPAPYPVEGNVGPRPLPKKQEPEKIVTRIDRSPAEENAGNVSPTRGESTHISEKSHLIEDPPPPPEKKKKEKKIDAELAAKREFEKSLGGLLGGRPEQSTEDGPKEPAPAEISVIPEVISVELPQIFQRGALKVAGTSVLPDVSQCIGDGALGKLDDARDLLMEDAALEQSKKAVHLEFLQMVEEHNAVRKPSAYKNFLDAVELLSTQSVGKTGRLSKRRLPKEPALCFDFLDYLRTMRTIMELEHKR